MKINKMSILNASAAVGLALGGLMLPGNLFQGMAAHAQEPDAQQTSEQNQVEPQAGIEAPEAQENAVEAPTEKTPSKSLEKFRYAPDKSSYRPDYQTSIGFMNSFSVIDKKGRVRIIYENARTTGTRPLLRSLQYLQNVPVSKLDKNDQLAYWLNLRNMLVIFAITVDRSSDLTEERGTFDNPGPLWTTERITVEGVSLSIDDIERGIILKHWRDPNIIYGLYQGFQGGPSLYKPGFTGQNVNRVLPKLGRRYLSAKKTVSVKSSTANIPAVYQWYSDAFFKGEDRRIIAHLRKTSQVKLSKKLENVDKIQLTAINYNIDSSGPQKRKRETTRTVVPPQSRQQQPRGGRGGGGGRRSGS